MFSHFQEQICGQDTVRLARLALKLVSRSENPLEWAILKGRLAISLDECDREEAILHLTESLGIFTHIDYPVYWARGMSDLGRLHSDRAEGDPQANLETAINCFRGALEVLTEDAEPLPWAMSNHDLSVLYSRRTGADRSENGELALHFARQTLHVFTEKSHPEDYARCCTLIGITYRDRLLGVRQENLSEAISHCRKARAYYARQEDLKKCTSMDELIGQAYLLRANEGGGLSDATEAIEYLQSALRNINKQRDGDRWAGTARNLSLAQSLLSRNRRSDFENTIDKLNESLALTSRDSSPIEWADCQTNIGRHYLCLSKNGADEFQVKGAACIEAAADIYEEYGDLVKVRDVQQLLGDTCFRTSSWSGAHQAYEATLSAGLTLYEGAFTEHGRHLELASLSRTISRNAYALVLLGKRTDALESLERCRTKLLKEALAVEDQELSHMEEAQRVAIKKARAEIRRLEATMRAPSVPGATMREMAEQLRVARSGYRASIEEARAAARHFQKSSPWALEQILNSIPVGGAMIVPFQMSEFPSGAFVIPYGQKTISLDDVVHVLQPFLHVRGRPPAPLFDPSAASEGSARNFARVLQALSTSAMDPVIERLTSFELPKGAPILVLGTAFEALGLHTAAWNSHDGPCTALDLFSIRYVPSTQLSQICEDRMKLRGAGQQSVVAVIDPTADLKYSSAEGFIVEHLFEEGRYLTGQEADVTAVRSAISGASYLHFACHGRYSQKNPLESALMLAKGTCLTAADVVSTLDLRSSRLVVLSACQSGLTDLTTLAREYIGLPTAFLEAGSPSVLSTLWSVDDASTMLLIDRFYAEHVGSLLPASVALARAQVWLRDSKDAQFAEVFDRIRKQASPASLAYAVAEEGYIQHTLSYSDKRPFAEPYHWAPFILMGAEVPPS
jgi:hypothetical protein